jgi:hypothetical protein
MAAANTVAAWSTYLEEQQGFCSHKFHWYRNGLPDHHLKEWEIRDGWLRGDPALTYRWNDILARTQALAPPAPFPVPGEYQFTAAERDRLRGFAIPGRVPFRTLRPPPPGAPLVREARKAVTQEYTSAYSVMRSCFRYFKCLGWGSEGVASLWKYSPGPGQEHMVVMKMSSQWLRIDQPVPQVILNTAYIDKERQVISVSKYLASA